MRLGPLDELSIGSGGPSRNRTYELRPFYSGRVCLSPSDHLPTYPYSSSAFDKRSEPAAPRGLCVRAFNLGTLQNLVSLTPEYSY